MNERLVRPAPLCIQAGVPGPGEGRSILQTAIMGRGMPMQAGIGLAWIQVSVVATGDPSSVTVGFLMEGTSVEDDDGFNTNSAIMGWRSDGCFYQHGQLRGVADRSIVFGQGDQLILVMDCRREPTLRLLVNGRVRKTTRIRSRSLQVPRLNAAISLVGRSTRDIQATVTLENVPLPPGWDLPPPAE